MRILDTFYSSLKPGWRVLDLGAGEGKQAKIITGLGATVVAVDIKSPKVNIPLVTWNTLSIEEWIKRPFDNNPFDAVLARNIFQFFEKEYLKGVLVPGLSERLKSEGLIAVETFYKEPDPPFERPFKSFWNETEIKEIFQGWKIVASETEDGPGLDLSGKMRDFFRTGFLAQKL